MGFASKVSAFMKSLTAEEEVKDQDEDEDDLDLDDQDEDGESDNDGEMTKSENLVDATEILGSLVVELRDMNKSLKTLIDNQKTLEKSQGDVGGAVVGVAEMVARIANAPIPKKSAMAKGGLGGGDMQKSAQPDAPPTQAELEKAQMVLVKAVADREITMQKSEQISSDLQKSMVIPGYKMKPEDYEFLSRKMSA